VKNFLGKVGFTRLVEVRSLEWSFFHYLKFQIAAHKKRNTCYEEFSPV